MNSTRVFLSFAALLGLSSLTAADVLNVRGPSADYSEIQAAIDAAVDGDVVRVWPGVYDHFTVNNKHLTIAEAAPGAMTRVVGSIRIIHLDASKSVVLSGIDSRGVDGIGLGIALCDGSIRIRDAVFEGRNQDANNAAAAQGAVIIEARDVAFVDCSIEGGWSASNELVGHTGLVVERSRVSVYSSWLRGSGGGTEFAAGGDGGPGGAGLRVKVLSRVFLSGTRVSGGAGGAADADQAPFCGCYGYAGNGGYAIVSWRPTAIVTTLDCEIEPGAGGWHPVPGDEGLPGSSTPPDFVLPGVARECRVVSLSAESTPIQVSLVGAPGDQVFLSIDGTPGYGSTPFGPLLVHATPLRSRGRWLPVGTISALGWLQTALPGISLPAFGHESIHMQALFVGVETYLSSPSWTQVLDSAW